SREKEVRRQRPATSARAAAGSNQVAPAPRATRLAGSRPTPAGSMTSPPRPAHHRLRTERRMRAADRPANAAGQDHGPSAQRYDTALAALTTSSALISAIFSRLAA